MLWFDVESRYKATLEIVSAKQTELWFDVELRYEETRFNFSFNLFGSGILSDIRTNIWL